MDHTAWTNLSMPGQRAAPPHGRGFPAGTGEMAERIRAHDWAATPLGPLAGWPQSLRSVVELMLATPQPVYVAWGPALISLHNDACIPILGAKHPGALGQPFATLWAEIFEEFQPVLAATLAGQAQHFVDRPVALAGRAGRPVGWFTFSWTPLRDESGAIAGFYCAATETTEKVREEARQRTCREAALRASEARYRTLFEAIDEGFCIIEMLFGADGRAEDYRFLEVNPAFERQSGMRDPVGRRIREFAPQHEARWFETYGRVALTGEPVRFEDRAAGLGGRWFDVYAFRIGRPEQRQVAVLFTDISARKRAEAALRDSEARGAFLLALSDALRPLGDPDAIQATACRLLAGQLGADRIVYADAVRPDLVAYPPDRAAVAAAGCGEALAAACRRGEPVVVTDVAADPRLTAAERARLAERGIAACVSVPLMRDGNWAGSFSAQSAGPRAWTAPELALLREAAERIRAASARARAEAELRRSEALRRLALDAAGMGSFLWQPAEDRAETDARAQALFDLTAEEARSLRAAFARKIHPEDRPRYAAAVARATDPAGDGALREEIRLLLADGGERWLAIDGRSIFEGTPPQAVRMAGTVADITARKAAEARQTLLAREVDHRAKNVLAVVQSVVQLTPGHDPAAFRRAVQGRIAALARAQTLLAEDRWTGADLRTLLEGELAPFRNVGQRVVLSGPPVMLAPGMAQPMAMAMHELATNAVKHGALSVPEGSISVAWGSAAGHLRLRWTEAGGPPLPGPPERRGFGSRVLEGTVRAQLGGSVTLSWASSGLVCDLAVPLRRGPTET